MKVFLLSVDTADITWAADSGLIDGVVTTPAMLAGSGEHDDEQARLAEICRVTSLPVCATVAAVNRGDIYHLGRDLARISDNVVVHIPMVEDAMLPARRLTADGVQVGVTLVFTAAQALFAAKVGACMVTTSPDSIAEFGLEGSAALSEMAHAMRDYSMSCDVLVMSPRNAADVVTCMSAGVDGIIVDAASLRRLLVHPLTDRGLDALLHELSKTHRVKAGT